jgi:hypothetical protein
MKAAPLKKSMKSKLETSPAITQELPDRLAELEVELRLYPSRSAGEPSLESIEKPVESAIGNEKVVQFLLRKKLYAAGHTDATYSGSNHTRGVRHVRFYAAGKTVLDIEGDYEDQQFGPNFRFQNIDVYVPGEWEKDFVKLTDEFRHYKATRRNAFNKKRIAERRRLHRG